MQKTNRQKILEMSTYDMLCEIQDHLICGYDYGKRCVISLIDHRGGYGYLMRKCQLAGESGGDAARACKDCIAKWLNES